MLRHPGAILNMVWNVEEMVREIEAEADPMFLCPECLNLSHCADIEEREVWAVFPKRTGEIEHAACIEGKVEWIRMSICDCKVLGEPEDYIVLVDFQKRIVMPVGKYWKEVRRDKLEKFAKRWNLRIVG